MLLLLFLLLLLLYVYMYVLIYTQVPGLVSASSVLNGIGYEREPFHRSRLFMCPRTECDGLSGPFRRIYHMLFPTPSNSTSA